MGPEPADLTHISEKSNYRYLQRMAKSMKLPSNVKKKYLVQLILAKQFSSPEALNVLVARIKAERKRVSKPRKNNTRRKKWIQGNEISTTCCKSPSICTTPELPYAPYTVQTILRCKTSILNPLVSKQGQNKERVLRSSYYNTRLHMKYGKLNMNSEEVYEAQNTPDSSEEVQESYKRNKQKHQYRRARAAVQKSPPHDADYYIQPRLLFADDRSGEWRGNQFESTHDRQRVPFGRISNVSSRPATRERRLSGISPLKSSGQNYNQCGPTYHYSGQREDNRIANLNFLSQMPQRSTPKHVALNKMTQSNNLLGNNMKPLIISLKKAFQNPTTTVQDIVNSGIEGSYSSGEGKEIESVTKKPKRGLTYFVNVGKPGSRIKNYGRNVIKKYTIVNTRFERDSDVGTSELTCLTENPSETYSEDSFINFTDNQSEDTTDYNKNEATTDYKNEATTDYKNEATTDYEDEVTTDNENVARTGVYTEFKKNYDFVQSECTGSIVNPENSRSGSVEEAKYPNMSVLAEVYPDDVQEYVSVVTKPDVDIHYDRKIRTNNRTQSASSTYLERGPSEERLPRITDVFSQFNNLRHKLLTQLLYVDVGSDAERVGDGGSYHLKVAPTSKNEDLDQPLNLHLESGDTQTCGNSPLDGASIDVVAVAPATPATPAPATLYAEYSTDLFAADDQGHKMQACCTPALQDHWCMDHPECRDMRCDEVLQQSPVESVTSAVTSTFSEDMADAYEIISQDGDYMERIGMDVRTACVECDWTGARTILEHHVRMDHASLIVMRHDTKWSYSVSLSEVLEGVCMLSEYQSRVYVLCVMSFCADSCRATLSVLPKFDDANLDEQPYQQYGCITVYHKVTGEPYTWQGAISHPVPCVKEESPKETASNWLDLNLTSLNLLPNSANLMLVNGELLANSSAKVIAGQPEMDSIMVEFHVEISC